MFWILYLYVVELAWLLSRHFFLPQAGPVGTGFFMFNFFCFASSSLVGDVLLPFACTLAFFVVAYFDG